MCADDLDAARRAMNSGEERKSDISYTRLQKYEAEFDRFLKAGEASIRAERARMKQASASLDF